MCDRFLEGYSPKLISKELREQEIPGCTGKARWWVPKCYMENASK